MSFFVDFDFVSRLSQIPKKGAGMGSCNVVGMGGYVMSSVGRVLGGSMGLSYGRVVLRH